MVRLRLMKCMLAAVLFLLMFPYAGRTHDLVKPDWRGEEGTTYQQWTFDDDDNPAEPEVRNNDYGTASAAITIGSFGSGWLDQLPGFGSLSGYWDLFEPLGADDAKIVLDIDNNPQITPSKEIWIQVTYFEDISQAPTVEVPGAMYMEGQTLLVETAGDGAEWLLDQSKWQLSETSGNDTIIVRSDPNWGSVVDQIVVDTYSRGCIVAFDDLLLFCAQWLSQDGANEANLDGVDGVDFGDYSILAASWLKQCPDGWPWP